MQGKRERFGTRARCIFILQLIIDTAINCRFYLAKFMVILKIHLLLVCSWEIAESELVTSHSPPPHEMHVEQLAR